MNYRVLSTEGLGIKGEARRGCDPRRRTSGIRVEESNGEGRGAGVSLIGQCLPMNRTSVVSLFSSF